MDKKIIVDEESFITLVEDVRIIKAWVTGDNFHPNGAVQQIRKNAKCIQKLKRQQTGFFAVIGGAWTAFTVAISLLISKS